MGKRIKSRRKINRCRTKKGSSNKGEVGEGALKRRRRVGAEKKEGIMSNQ